MTITHGSTDASFFPSTRGIGGGGRYFCEKYTHSIRTMRSSQVFNSHVSMPSLLNSQDRGRRHRLPTTCINSVMHAALVLMIMLPVGRAVGTETLWSWRAHP
jgi:hypothetical protein